MRLFTDDVKKSKVAGFKILETNLTKHFLETNLTREKKKRSFTLKGNSSPKKLTFPVVTFSHPHNSLRFPPNTDAIKARGSYVLPTWAKKTMITEQ